MIHMLRFLLVLVLLFSSLASFAKVLFPPTGRYQVGVQNLVWVNPFLCPDPRAPRPLKASDFSPANAGFCREVKLRIYYPSVDFGHSFTTTPKLFIELAKKFISLPSERSKLDDIQIAAREGLHFASPRYPVILFSPTLLGTVQMYNSLLINIASHGYIVVGINSNFVGARNKLATRLLLKNAMLKGYHELAYGYQIKYRDMEFVYQKLLANQTKGQYPIFRHMDLRHVVVTGHLSGASAAIAMAHKYSSGIKAVIAMDAPNETDPILNKTLAKHNVIFPDYYNIFNGTKIPMLQIHSSKAVVYLHAPKARFHLLHDNYLMTIAKPKGSQDYFRYMDFTDYTLLKGLSGLSKDALPREGLGSVNGNVALSTVSHYILTFLQQTLHDKVSLKLRRCKPLTSNTQIACGQGT